jgi:hypothetical protein
MITAARSECTYGQRQKLLPMERGCRTRGLVWLCSALQLMLLLACERDGMRPVDADDCAYEKVCNTVHVTSS